MQSEIAIIMPCYNESSIIMSFLSNMEHILAALPFRFRIIVVNDHSTDNTLQLLEGHRCMANNVSLDILHLGQNIGHQGAIYQGLHYAMQQRGLHFIIMDSDGEDAPAIIPALLQQRDADIVHVVRSKRRESVLFRLFYHAYKHLFRIVNGKQMNFGNFCLISRPILERAVNNSFVHFAAFLSKQKGTARYITADREERLGGHSKMGFAKLVQHAFRSFAEYSNEGRYGRPYNAIYEIVAPANEPAYTRELLLTENYA